MRVHILMIAILAILVSAAAYADSTHEGGRQIWKKNCRIACHDGRVDGSPVLSPDSKTQTQWKNSFANEKDYIKKFHKTEELKHLSSSDWDAIYDFVYHHAHDSDNPEDCMGSNGEMVR